MARTLTGVLVAAVLAGCGDRSAIEEGGRVPGDTVTVYVLVPQQGRSARTARAVVRGAKLALLEAGGRAGEAMGFERHGDGAHDATPRQGAQ